MEILYDNYMNKNIVDKSYKVLESFIETDPFRAAESLDKLTISEATSSLLKLEKEDIITLLNNMSYEKASQVLERIPVKKAASILSKLDSYHSAKIFMDFSAQLKANIVKNLTKKSAKALSESLDYPQDSAGRIMHSGYITFYIGVYVRDVIKKLKTVPKKKLPPYCYVVGKDQKLVGLIKVRDLFLYPRDLKVGSIMTVKVPSVSPFTDRQELLHIMKIKKYLEVPIVDNNKIMLGVVDTESLIETAEQEASEDMQILFGASADEKISTPISQKIGKRIGWLNINLVTAFLAVIVIAFFEGLISEIPVLAVFLPVVAGQGGNAGIQTLSVVLRAIIMKEIEPKNAFALVGKETVVSLINGILIGLISGAVIWFWQENIYLSLTIFVAMIVNMVASCIAGVIIPLSMKRLGYDPAQSSGIFITMISDIIGFASFLGCAYLLRNFL
ncbi:MAG: magnesium transporter [Elusimicrobiaceae bacterium]|nr:magnesium transporter [Elusimicrobiaceae bacterium]MBT3955050.1 magnesium transporter [Elusimicrobiaceae bacterium]MBT5987270.1 magnesium transporter [Elusimicrobiaceae bacterium]MBT7283521.1 magnesium transporter [Elusimicrobiaceae bacterium]